MVDNIETFNELMLSLCIAIAGAEEPIAAAFACEGIIITAKVLEDLAGLRGDDDSGDDEKDDDNDGGESGGDEDGGVG